MSLTPGARLGPYEVVGSLGAGGMGEVYRARDTTLNRDVAIKVMPEAVAGDPDRLARFRREAEALAALNHTNIAQVFGFEHHGDIWAIAMELVEGDDLSHRIAQGAMPLEDALPIARQIADALEAAHERGIIHRDLKPANIKVRDDGTVKVLDFGLAKAMDPPGEPSPDMANSPTLTARATQMGMIIGTAAYMAPEQARGKVVDRRADIWAFGAVVYEMLTGTRAFAGEDVTDTLAAVVRAEPEWERLPEAMSPSLRVFLQRCLEKDPKRRVGDVHDVRLALEGAFEAAAPAATTPDSAPAPGLWQRPAVIATLALAAAVLSGLAVWGTMRGEPTESPDLIQFSVVPPDAAPLMTSGSHQDLAISPDGTRIVYRSRTPTGTELSLRSVGQIVAAPIRGTEEGARGPFFSPDGQWIGFQDPGSAHLRKVPLSGGSPVTIAETPFLVLGASWGAGGQIIFGTYAAGLFRVPAAGGEPEELTTPDRERGEQHSWPFIIPGRAAVLFVTNGGRALTDGTIAVLDLESGDVTPLGLAGVSPRYVSTGHVVYAAEDGSVRAVPFDVDSLTVSGDPVPLVQGVAVKTLGAADFSISDNGRLVYVSGAAGGIPRSLVWVERDGATTPIAAEPSQYRYPRISQDGQHLAVVGENGIRVWDFRLETLTRLTTEELDNYPVWAPDGRRLAYRTDRDVYWKAWNNTGSAELLVKNPGEGDASPYFFSQDGRTLVFREQLPDGIHENLGMIATEEGAEPVWLLRSESIERNAVLSPNGRWIAYQSNASERFEVFVSPFPNFEDDRVQISNAGGEDPLWSPDGRELFYLERGSPSRLMVLSVETEPDFVPGARRALLDWPYADGGDGRNFDVATDGQRFLAITELPVTADADVVPTRPSITVVLNWFEELKRLSVR